MAKASGNTRMKYPSSSKGYNMKESTYKEMSKTAQGRKEVHGIMIEEAVARFKQFIDKAPAKNKEILEKMLQTFKEKVNNMGNGNLFDFLANDQLSDSAFIGYVQDVIKGKIW